MKIKKNGKVVNLTESDLQRIVKRTLSEQDNQGEPEIDRDFDFGADGTLLRRDDQFITFLNTLGGFKPKENGLQGEFIRSDGKTYVIGLEWVYNEVGVPDDPKWVDEDGRGKMGREFYRAFKNRKNIQ